MMAYTQKLIIFPVDYLYTFRVCNSASFVQFCLGYSQWAVSSCFWPPSPKMSQSCGNLTEHSTLFPAKLRETARIHSSVTWRTSSQVSQIHAICSAPLTHGEIAQNFAEVHTLRNQQDLELHRVIVDLETDLSSNSGSSFQLATHSSWLECLPVKHWPASIRQCECSAHKHLCNALTSASSPAAGVGMPSSIHLGDAAQHTKHAATPLYWWLCKLKLSIITLKFKMKSK